MAGKGTSTDQESQHRSLRALVPKEETEAIVHQPIVPKINPKVAQLHALAAELGYFCQPRDRWIKHLAHEISTRLRTREGQHIYQSAACNIPNFPKQLCSQIFEGFEMTDDSSATSSTWRLTTMSQTSRLFGSIFEEQAKPTCVGATRAIMKPSESVSRVMATVMAFSEFSHVLKAGKETLFINFNYVLSDEDGELHPPKDNNRIEIALSPMQEQSIRQQILLDVNQMAMAGVKLAPGWWRQLAQPDKALEVEALLLNAAAQPKPPKGSGKRKARADVFEVEAIVEEQRGWVLVRWRGYHPSWEAWRISGNPGDPVETWERLSKMRQTEAYQIWIT